MYVCEYAVVCMCLFVCQVEIIVRMRLGKGGKETMKWSRIDQNIDKSVHVSITTALCCVVLYCIALYCFVLYCTVLYCTVLYYTALYSTALFCTALYSTALYCTIKHPTALISLTCTVRTDQAVSSPVHYVKLGVKE